jgi:hypothetical protein
VAQQWQPRHDRLDPRRELLLIDEGDEVGVLEEVGQLVFDIAVVDVDPHGTDLEDGPERLNPLH